MSNTADANYVNMSAYVALSCLIAFVIVITICLVKQFIWDPLLAKPFEVLRPVLTESVRKLSTSFYRPQSTSNSTFSIHKSTSDSCVQSNEAPLLINKNLIPVPENNLFTVNQVSPPHRSLPHRSYGSSSLNAHAYTNFGSDEINDENNSSYPVLHFSCEYNPSTFSVRLNIQNLRNMNALLPVFHPLIHRSACIFVRFMFYTPSSGEPYDTSLQHVEDFIRFGDTFNILSNIRAGDALNYQIKFNLMLATEKGIYELGNVVYSMKDDHLTQILFLERILPMHIEKQAKSIATESSNWDLQVLPCFTVHLALFTSDCCSCRSFCLVSITEPMLSFLVNTPTKKNHLSLSPAFSFGEHDRTIVFCSEDLCISWESPVRCLYNRNVNHSKIFPEEYGCHLDLLSECSQAQVTVKVKNNSSHSIWSGFWRMSNRWRMMCKSIITRSLSDIYVKP